MEPIHPSVKEALERAERIESIAARVREERVARWKNRAGRLYDEMTANRDGAVRCLQHADPRIRNVAIEVLLYIWKPGPDDRCTQVLENMALTDVDDDVRCGAIIAIGACYKGTRNARVGRVLASLVLDESTSLECRRAAYAALFRLHRTNLPEWPGLYATPPTMFRIPEDIDWLFVQRFLGSKGALERDDGKSIDCPMSANGNREPEGRGPEGVGD